VCSAKYEDPTLLAYKRQKVTRPSQFINCFIVMALRRKNARRPKRSKVYRRGRVARRRLQPSFQGVVPQSLHTRFSAVGKRRRTGPFSATGSRSAYGGAGSATLHKRRKVPAPVRAITELSKSRRSVYMQKYNLSRVVHVLTNNITTRFQLISNFDTNVGAQFLDNFANSTSGSISMPMVIVDCGSLYQPYTYPDETSNAVVSRPFWSGGTSATVPLGMESLVGQNPDGTVSGDVGFQTEKADLNNPVPFSDAVLNWVNLRMNLYGQRKRTTKFVITVFQVTDEDVDPVHGDPDNLDRKALFQYLERPFIYSNLQQDSSLKKTGMRIIKEFTYNVAPMTSIDLNTTTGNIHEANLHIKINKRMEYLYNKAGTAMLPHAQEDGLDFNRILPSNSLHQSPRPKQNVFIAIRAFAPVRVSESSADDSPSFDVIIRRNMTTVN